VASRDGQSRSMRAERWDELGENALQPHNGSTHPAFLHRPHPHIWIDIAIFRHPSEHGYGSNSTRGQGRPAHTRMRARARVCMNKRQEDGKEEGAGATAACVGRGLCGLCARLWRGRENNARTQGAVHRIEPLDHIPSGPLPYTCERPTAAARPEETRRTKASSRRGC
jgi:hypothetical protein